MPTGPVAAPPGGVHAGGGEGTGAGTGTGGGAGLLGMRERAERLGGAFDASVREGWFVVSARLPWSRDVVSVPAPTVGA
ncbi:MAG: hypothetical protein H5T83_04770 [Actinotalea sp.]|nr:hypothetical protein [Actinotalea sp.]